MAHNRTGYVGGCRCPVCREANRVYQRRYYRRRHRPDATPVEALVDASSTSRRLGLLVARGWTLSALSARTSIPRSTLADIAAGRRVRTHNHVAAGIAAVRVDLKPPPRRPG